MTGQTDNKGPLARVAVVAGILGTVATIIGVFWTILHREDRDVPDYQSQVLATCDQIHKILAVEHNEIFIFDAQGDVDSPDDLVRIRKDLLVRVMENNLVQAKNAFAALNQREVPSDLAPLRQEAVKAQDAWYAAVLSVIEIVKERLPKNPRLSDVQELGVDVSGSDPGANIRLNSAMTALAGRSCQVGA